MSIATLEDRRVLDESGNLMFEVNRWGYITLSHGDHFPDSIIKLGQICLVDSEARRVAEVLESFAAGDEIAVQALHCEGVDGPLPMFKVETWSFGGEYLTLAPQAEFFGEEWAGAFTGGYHFTRTEAVALADALRDVLG